MRHIIPIISAALFAALTVCFVVDYIDLKYMVKDQGKEIAALKLASRPLIVMGKFSRVTVRGHEVVPEIVGNLVGD